MSYFVFRLPGGRWRRRKLYRGLVNTQKLPSPSEEHISLQAKSRRKESARSTWLLKVCVRETQVLYMQLPLFVLASVFPSLSSELISCLSLKFMYCIVMLFLFPRCKWTGCAESQNWDHKANQGRAHQISKYLLPLKTSSQYCISSWYRG